MAISCGGEWSCAVWGHARYAVTRGTDSCAYGDSVQDHRQVLAGDLLGAVLSARPVPGRGDPHGVAHEPVGEPDVEVAAEDLRGDPAFQRGEPGRLESALRFGEERESLLGGEVPGLLLVDGDGGAVPVDLPEGLGDQRLKSFAGVEFSGQDGVVAVPQLVEE